MLKKNKTKHQLGPVNTLPNSLAPSQVTVSSNNNNQDLDFTAKREVIPLKEISVEKILNKEKIKTHKATKEIIPAKKTSVGKIFDTVKEKRSASVFFSQNNNNNNNEPIKEDIHGIQQSSSDEKIAIVDPSDEGYNYSSGYGSN